MRSDKKLLQKIFNSSLGTIILSELAFSVCSVIDGILSGQYLGDTALAAIGICAPFPSILAVFSGILSAGCQARCSYYMGRGEKDNANSVFSTVILVSMLFSALMTFVIVVFTVPAAEILGAAGRDAELHDGTVDYLRACAIGTVGMIMDTILWPIVQLEGKHLHMRAAVIVLAGMNIIGDLLNMFVFGGGLFGVGLVTAISYICASSVLGAALLTKNVSFSFSFRLVKLSILPGLLYKGVPKAVRRGCSSLRVIFLIILTTMTAAESGVAALAVQLNLMDFLGGVGAGIAETMVMISGVVFAENDTESLRLLYKGSIIYILLLEIPITVLLIISAPLIVGLYMPEQSEAVNMAVSAVRCYSLALPFAAFNEMYINYFQGTGRSTVSSVVSFFSRIGTIIPTGIIFGVLLGIDGIWFSLFVSEALLSLGIVLAALIFGKNDNMLEKLLFIEKDKYGDIRFYDTLISQKGEEIGLAERIGLFCKENGVDDRRSYLASLFCEELVTNITEYGFSEEKRHCIDLRVSLNDGEIRIRIRDDCKPFDPQKWYELNHSEDPAANIGIKIVMKMSRRFEYTTTFRMNNVIIVI